jgi:hypothetical protein
MKPKVRNPFCEEGTWVSISLQIEEMEEAKRDLEAESEKDSRSERPDRSESSDPPECTE